METKAEAWELNQMCMSNLYLILLVYTLHLQFCINSCMICIIHVRALRFCYCDSLENTLYGYLPQENEQTQAGGEVEVLPLESLTFPVVLSPGALEELQ